MVNLLIFAMRYPPEEVGTALYAGNLARGLSERGVKVTVLAPAYGRDRAEDGEAGFPIRRIAGGHHPLTPLRYPIARAALAGAVRELAPQVVWATNGMATRVAGTMLGKLPMPLIGSLHGTDITTRLPGRSPRTWIESLPQRAFYRRASCLVTNSRFTLEAAVAKGIERDRLKLAYLGIEVPEDLEEVRRTAAARLPDVGGRRVVLTVARLVPQKGHRLLIDAMRPLLRARPDVLHVIVGDGPGRAGLADQVRRLGLDEQVLLAGRVSDAELQAWYAEAALFALTSHAVEARVEGLGFVFLEAAARGLPAVGSSHGGIPEAIVDGQTGFLVDPDRPEQITERIALLLDDDERRREMGELARNHVESRFGVERMMDECFAILQEVHRRLV